MSVGTTVRFGAQDTGLQRTIGNIQREMGRLGNQTNQTSRVVRMSFASMAAAGASFAVGLGVVRGAFRAVTRTVGNFQRAIDLGSRLNDLSSKTGIAAGELTVLERAFQNAGVSAESVGPSINRMQRSIVEAGDRGGVAAEAFEKLGVSLVELRKKGASEQFQILSKRIAALPNDTERAAVAMQIFGRAGANLLPMMRDFGGSIDEARAQLGTLPAIMDRLDGQFDKISDNLKAVREKAVELAAGILSRLAPALEIITDRLAKIDAAAVGQRIADIFVGAGEAMDGFQTALDAIRLGEFEMAMKAVAVSIRLQFGESANSIYKHLVGAFQAASHAIMEISKTIFALLKRQFSTMFQKLSLEIGEILLNILPKVMIQARRNIRTNMRLAENIIKNNINSTKNIIQDLPSTFSNVARESREAFTKGMGNAKDLINTQGLSDELRSIQNQIEAMAASARAQQAMDAAKNTTIKISDLELKIGDQRVDIATRIKELEADILRAKAAGNREEQLQLEATRKYYQELQKAQGAGLSMQEALALASKAYQESIKGASTAMEKTVEAAKEVAQQLALSAQLAERIKAAQAAERIDPGGRQQARFDKALRAGNVAAAERAVRNIARAELEAEARMGDDGNWDRRNLQDIARELGIDTFRKTTKQLREEIAKRRREEREKQAAAADPAKGAPGDPAKPDEPPPPKPEEKLNGIVEEIKTILGRLERKLPSPALV